MNVLKCDLYSPLYVYDWMKDSPKEIPQFLDYNILYPSETLEQQIAEIDKLNSIINSMEEEMVW